MKKRPKVTEASFDVVAIRDIKRLTNRLLKKISILEKAFVKRTKARDPKASPAQIQAAFEAYELGREDPDA